MVGEDNGGENPCRRPIELEHIRAKTGRPCPRVELFPENALPYHLVSLALSERARPLLLEVLKGEDLAPEIHRVVVGRVVHALFSVELDEALKGPRDPEPAKGK
jgi:hypothetical protein